MMKNKMRRKIGKCAIALCVLFSLLSATLAPMTTWAEPDSDPYKEALKSTLSAIPASAIQLSTPEDVLALAENCRVNTWSVGKHIVLTNDIDMTGVAFNGISTFGGHFEGLGHKISGIHMEQEGSVVGFFRYLQKNAVVTGLTIQGTILPEGSHSVVGGFVGNNAGTIVNCSFEGVVAGAQQIGGFAGINETTGLIESCTASGMIYGNHFVGGFVGENHGVIRKSTNQAEINTQSVHNSVDLEDITLDSVINTESAGTTTDIGGIAGSNSGVIRECINKGIIGYKKMGYNIGGIVGTQNGYVVDCINYSDVQGRKEVGGIVGHMEPNIVLKFSEDTLQTLSGQMTSLESSMGQLEGSIKDSSSDIENSINNVENEINNVENAIDILSKPVNPDAENPEDFVDVDKLTAATNDLSASLENIYTESENIQKSSEAAKTDIGNQMEVVIADLEQVMNTVSGVEEGINLTMEDISGSDTDEDTVGKVSNCENYGNISGDLNIGGIAGIMAEENDFDDYSDTTILGDVSLNASGQARVVIRDSVNYGTINASKTYAGGITGQMPMGAVLECINVGSMDSINADYVGGIAGDSATIIRNCSSKCIMAGDTYVGGIAGCGSEVKDCYAFVDIKACVEKAGGIVGLCNTLPDGSEDTILRNYFYNAGKEVGGIDGIAYSGATDRVDIVTFLQLPNLSDLLRKVTVSFIAEGQDDVVLTLNMGDSLTMDQIPTIAVEANSEYEWELIPDVTSEILSMGETAAVEYLSEESITNILFNQTYEVVFDLKDTVISSAQRNGKGLSIALAEGTFAKHTTLELADLLSSGEVKEVDGKAVAESWKVVLSNSGVSKLHYLVSDEHDIEKLKLYVQTASGSWEEREYVVEGSYIVFDFSDGETGFALQETAGGSGFLVMGLIILVVAVLVGVIVSKIRKKQQSK